MSSSTDVDSWCVGRKSNSVTDAQDLMDGITRDHRVVLRWVVYGLSKYYTFTDEHRSSSSLTKTLRFVASPYHPVYEGGILSSVKKILVSPRPTQWTPQTLLRKWRYKDPGIVLSRYGCTRTVGNETVDLLSNCCLFIVWYSFTHIMKISTPTWVRTYFAEDLSRTRYWREVTKTN